jgi:hypothetical protein
MLLFFFFFFTGRASALTAICLTGDVGAPQAVPSLLTHVIRYEQIHVFHPKPESVRVFAAVSSVQALESLTPLEPYRGVFRLSVDYAFPDYENIRIPGNWISPLNNDHTGHGALQLRQLQDCYQWMRGTHFDRIIISRLDMMWLTPRAKMPTPDGCTVPCQGNDFNGLCDHYALCNHAAGELYLNRASLVEGPPIPKDWMNAEVFLQYALRGVNVSRFGGYSTPFRSCPSPDRGCVWNEENQVYYKPSGTEFKEALDCKQKFEQMIKND